MSFSDFTQCAFRGALGGSLGYASACLIPTVTPFIGGVVIGSMIVIYPVVDHFFGPLKKENQGDLELHWKTLVDVAKLAAAVAILTRFPSGVAFLASQYLSLSYSFYACLAFEVQTGLMASLTLFFIDIFANIPTNVKELIFTIG